METNFKVDVPSFALGYSAGKKKGGSGGGGAELNIHYSLDTPPEDTSKLWVKTAEPNGVLVSNDVVFYEGGHGESVSQKKFSVLNRFLGGVGAVDKNVYSFGGRTANALNGSNAIVRYNTESQTASTLGFVLPKSPLFPACASVGRKIFLFGGQSLSQISNNSNEGYDSIIEVDGDSGKAVLLESRLTVALSQACACAVGSKIYIFGGYNYRDNIDSDWIWVFDTETKDYPSKKNTVLPVASRGMACASVGDKIYLFGGNKTLTDIYCYDTTNDSIELLPEKLYRGVMGIGCCTVEDVICLAGGNIGDDETVMSGSNALYVFETVSGKLKKSSLFSGYANMWAMSATVDGSAYTTQTNNNGYVTKYTPKIGKQLLDSGHLQIFPTTDRNTFPFINTETVKVEIGAREVHVGSLDNESLPVEAALYKDGEWVTIQ
jgi:hypothetical protein